MSKDTQLSKGGEGSSLETFGFGSTARLEEQIWECEEAGDSWAKETGIPDVPTRRESTTFVMQNDTDATTFAPILSDTLSARVGRGPGAHFDTTSEVKSRPGRSYHDEEVKGEICRLLCREDTVDASELQIEVTAGCVVLRGMIATEECLRYIESVVSKVRGVRGVASHVAIAQPHAH